MGDPRQQTMSGIRSATITAALFGSVLLVALGLFLRVAAAVVFRKGCVRAATAPWLRVEGGRRPRAANSGAAIINRMDASRFPVIGWAAVKFSALRTAPRSAGCYCKQQGAMTMPTWKEIRPGTLPQTRPAASLRRAKSTEGAFTTHKGKPGFDLRCHGRQTLWAGVLRRHVLRRVPLAWARTTIPCPGRFCITTPIRAATS